MQAPLSDAALQAQCLKLFPELFAVEKHHVQEKVSPK